MGWEGLGGREEAAGGQVRGGRGQAVNGPVQGGSFQLVTEGISMAGTCNSHGKLPCGLQRVAGE